jgi:hypothetical protein
VATCTLFVETSTPLTVGDTKCARADKLWNTMSLMTAHGYKPTNVTHAFNSRFSSLRKRQSAPAASSAFGLARSIPASCRRSP